MSVDSGSCSDLSTGASACGLISNCASATSCNSCLVASGCAWCYDPGECLSYDLFSVRYTLGECRNYQSSHSQLVCADGATLCATKTSCATCVANSFCSWCGATSTCMYGTWDGPIGSSPLCPGNYTAPNTPDACTGEPTSAPTPSPTGAQRALNSGSPKRYKH